MAELTYPADPFAALGLSRDATPFAIKARYYQLARKYHPNSNHGVDSSQRALTEHFHRIYDAYTLLSKESHRRRYIEWSELEELDNAVDSHRLDLEYIEAAGESESDGWSSDLDDFEVASFSRGRRSRRPSIEPEADIGRGPSASVNGSAATGPASRALRGRGVARRVSNQAAARLQDEQRESSAALAAADRRKKLNRIKRKELEVFEAYRAAKIAELRAQVMSERLKDIYLRTKTKRELIEKIPLETTTRVKLVQNINRVVRMLGAPQRQVPNRQRLSVSTSILGDADILGSPMSARSGVHAHRRGWSSDISGDQTDSDDETPHATIRIPYRASTPSGRPPPSRDRSPMPQPPAPKPPPVFNNPFERDESPHSRPDSKFRLFVKRPTGFDDYDVPEELTSPVLRSPVHTHANACRDLVRIDAFTAHDSSDTVAGATLSSDSDSDISRSPVRGSMFEVKSIGGLRFPNHIPFSHVHKLDIREEYRLLGKPLDTGADPSDLLRQISVWDKKVAERFTVKPDIKESFAFRLICSNGDFVRQRHRSFIALSYRRRLTVEKVGSAFSLPLTKEMMQAVWEERVGDDEGLWIDQCCIKQDDDFERTVSMSAMDLVYRGARLIVVVLDDIEFKQHESDVLQSHVEEYERLRHVAPNKRFRRHSPPWLDTHEDLFNVIDKLLSAAWFKRAWCRHEMRLAQDHVFLIPCHTVGHYKKKIIRLSSACLAHLLALSTEVPFNTEIEILKAALHAFFRDRTDSHHSADRSHHGNFTTVAAEVFRMEAGGDPRLPEDQREADARWDKMSIILNAMECGLTLQSSMRSTRLSMTKEDCYYSLMMLALAARDPGALCAAGKPLILAHPGHVHPVTSWFFEPTIVDAGLNNYKTLTRIPLDSQLCTGISDGAHWVQLDLKFLEHDTGAKRLVAADVPELMSLSRDFVQRCEICNWGRHRKRYLINNHTANHNFGSMREVYTQTLAGVFWCGPDWMTSICQRYGVSRWKQDLQCAYWLLVSIRNMNGKWPVLPRTDDWTAKAAAFVMDFVNFLVIRGMPQRQMVRPEVWRPLWVMTKNRGKVLTYTPDRDDIFPVIPSVLLDADYLHLARLWLVQGRKAASEWTLLGKSVLFSDELAKQVINVEDEMVRRQQMVYGRDSSS